MAHSHHMHREHQVSHRRVNKILEEAPAEAKRHASGGAFSKVTSKSAAEAHDARPAGKSSPKRYARGGKVKGNTTNIIIAGGGEKQPTPMPMPMPAGPPPGAGGPPPGGPPPGAGGPPPGAGGPPPGMPMRKSGGRIPGGTSTKANLDAMSKRAKDNSYARGGKITAGAESGEGRLQKARIAKRG